MNDISLRFIQLLYCVSLKIYNKFANYICELKLDNVQTLYDTVDTATVVRIIQDEISR